MDGQALGGFHDKQDSPRFVIRECNRCLHESRGRNHWRRGETPIVIGTFWHTATDFISQACGRILFPAGRNAVVVLKPTVGLASRTGLLSLNPEHDSAGPITRWVKDSARILQVITGKYSLLAKRPQRLLTSTSREQARTSWTRPATRDIPFDSIPNYVTACSVDGCRGVRIAVGFTPANTKPTALLPVANTMGPVDTKSVS